MITTHQNGATITVMLAARAINPLSRLFQRELAALIDKLEAQRHPLHGVIIGFHAETPTADHELEHLMALTTAQAGDCMHMLGAYNALLRRLETLGIPVIATLSGPVTGHALGLALACHRRISLEEATCSLPQVHLGMTPVAGEIARTARLAGLQAAMPLLLEGATLNAAQALKAGLLHAVADDEQHTAQLVHHALEAVPVQPWEAKACRLPGGEPQSAPVQALLQVAPAMLRERTGGHAPAPEAILCAMVEGLQVDFDTALLIESRYFCQTAITPVARNLMRLSQISVRPGVAGGCRVCLHAAAGVCRRDRCAARRRRVRAPAAQRRARRRPAPAAGRRPRGGSVERRCRRPGPHVRRHPRPAAVRAGQRDARRRRRRRRRQRRGRPGLGAPVRFSGTHRGRRTFCRTCRKRQLCKALRSPQNGPFFAMTGRFSALAWKIL
jgi:enoyl-CoA hydratase/carnithine racemase